MALEIGKVAGGNQPANGDEVAGGDQPANPANKGNGDNGDNFAAYMRVASTGGEDGGLGDSHRTDRTTQRDNGSRPGRTRDDGGSRPARRQRNVEADPNPGSRHRIRPDPGPYSDRPGVSYGIFAACRRSAEQTFADEMTRRARSGEPRHPHATRAAVPPHRPAAGDPVLTRTVATKAAPADTRAAPDTGGAAAGPLLDSKLAGLNTRLAGIRNAFGLTTEVRSELQGLTSWINRFRRGQITGALSREQRESAVRAASAKIQEVRGRIQWLLNQANARSTFFGAPIISVDPRLPPDFPPFSQVQMARLEALRDALTGLPGLDRHKPEAMPPTAAAGRNGGVTLANARSPARAAPVQAAPARAAAAAAAAQPDDPAVVAAADKIKRLVKQMDDASVGFDSELHLARDRELYVLREQIRFHEARRAIVDYLGQARATIHGLRPEQAAALVKKLGDAKELGDNALAKLANYDSRLHSYMEAYEEYNAQQPRSPLAFNRLHGGIRTRDEALAMPPPPEYAEGVNSVALDDLKLHGRVPLPPTPIPDPIILELAQKVSDNHEAEPLAALMNAYQSASGLAPPPALSITGFLDIRPGETSFEYYNARVTPNFHRLIVGTGQMFIDRNGVDQAVKLVTLVAPQVLPSMRNGANGRVIRTGYPMTAEGKGPDRQDIVRFGDGRGVVVGNAIYAISQRSPGDAVQLKAVAARLGVVRRKEDRPPDVKDDVLQNVMNSLLQRWRVVVGGGATLTEAFRSRMTAAGDYYSNFTGMNYNPKDNPAKIGLFAYETEPSWAGGLAGSLLPTNHPSANDHLIGADYEPFARLIDVLARPEFSPVSDAVVEEQAWMRAHTFRVAVNALYDTAHVLSTDDDMVFPQDLAKFFIRPLALKLASLAQDHPSRIMRQLKDSDTLGVAGGEVLTKWLALLHDPNKIPEHIESKPITREKLAELDLIAPPSSERPAGGPLWPIFQQLLFGDGQHAPTNNNDWDAQATLYYLQGDNMASRVKNDNLDTMGRENLAYFMGAYSGLMSLLSKLKMEKEELSRYEWRAAFGVMRQLGTPALVTTYAPKQLPFLGIAGSLFNKVFVPFDVFGSIWSSYMLEQITSDAVKEAWLTSATLSHFDFLIGHFGMPDIEDGMSRYGFRKQSLFNNTTGSKLHGMRQQVEMMFGSGAEYGRQTMGFGYRSH